MKKIPRSVKQSIKQANNTPKFENKEVKLSKMLTFIIDYIKYSSNQRKSIRISKDQLTCKQMNSMRLVDQCKW